MAKVYGEEELLSRQLDKLNKELDKRSKENDELSVQIAETKLESAKLQQEIHQNRSTYGFIGFVTREWGNLCCDCYDKKVHESLKFVPTKEFVPTKNVFRKGMHFLCECCGLLIE